jgi:hypothetical protein
MLSHARMGASWRRVAAPVLLLLLAAALAPVPAAAGSASDPEVTDAAGDQAIDRGTLPVVPGVNDAPFDDVDVTAAYVAETGGTTRITVQTTAGWTTGSMTLTFNVTSGPTSLPSSAGTARAFTVQLNGTVVSGVNGTASTTTDGLRIDLPTSALGAVGGDLLTDLTIATTRTDPGNLQGVTQDDQTATDSAGPGRAYTYERPPVAGHLRLDVLGGTAGTRSFNGSQATGDFPSGSTVRLRVTNDGLDPDDVSIVVSRSGSQPVGSNLTQPLRIPAGATRTVTAALTFPNQASLPAGDTELTFTATSTLQGHASAVLRVHVASAPIPPAEREVKPAGLTFLSSVAEGMGLDGAFGSYAEAFLLALIVLLVILAIYLLLALGRSTLAGEPAPEAPWPDETAAAPAGLRASAGTRAGPSGLAQTVRASPARSVVQPVDLDEESMTPIPPMGDAETAPVASPSAAPVATAAPTAIRIEDVRHEPKEPEAGQRVVTEVILRNEGPSASLRLALSVDGKPAAERTVQVPSRATKAVELPWTAGPGDNRVRIQAFPA